MKVTELLTEGLKKEKAEAYAAAVHAVHNELSKRYGEVFKKIGIRRWPMDDTHPLKPHNTAAFASYLQIMKGKNVKHTLPRPLTVLDSYPNTSQKDRNWLDAEVDKIWKDGKRKLAKINKDFGF